MFAIETKSATMKQTTFDGVKFGKTVKMKRVIELDIDLRLAAKKIGVSAPTLSRIENGHTPDINTFATLCTWGDFNMYDFFYETKRRKPNATTK